MESYRTDEEQVEVLKRWWDENGNATVITIVLMVAGVFGWQTWQKRHAASMDDASVIYQELLDSVASETALNATQVSSVEHLAKQLRTDHENSTYAQYAGLLMAKIHVGQGKLAEGRAALEAVLEQRPNKELVPLVTLRLAEVIFAEGDSGQALEMLDTAETGGFAAAYAELRGDIQQDMGDLAAAKAAYESALEKAGEDNQLLTLKLANVETQLTLPSLGTTGVAPAAATSKGSAEATESAAAAATNDDAASDSAESAAEDIADDENNAEASSKKGDSE